MERNGQTNSNTQRELMSYHLKAGHIIRIRRGFFASIPISFKPEKFTADPYLIAGRVCKDSVLGYHSALSFYGTAYSIYQDFYFFTKQSMQSFSYQG
ncbi:MAG: hypothetical protein JSS53_00565, partial [Proteobacteria bacterium]|nr:hypothetical protein [Pseudomonadota bacterium]